MIINPLKQFLQYEPLFTLSTIGTTFINDLEESFNGLIESSSIPNMGNFLGNIGNGNIRNTIYGFNWLIDKERNKTRKRKDEMDVYIYICDLGGWLFSFLNST